MVPPLTSLHIPSTLVLPPWRATLRRAVPNVVEGKLIPVLLFVGLLEFVGTTAALLGALAWSVGALVRRRFRREAASGILILTTVGLAARTVAALATGSLVVYFLQPTLATALVAAAFFGSVVIGSPLAERLMLDVIPVDDDARDHPTLRRFLSHVSLWWGFTSAVNFGITLWLLLSHSTTTFVLVKSVLGPITTTVTLIVAYLWFRSLMARSGTQVVFAEAPVRVR
ncbi:MAG: VC0807 family protein [Acidimicrobiales bacterium]